MQFFSLVYMLGFFIGIIYTNIFAKEYIISIGILSEYFLTNYSMDLLENKAYILEVVKIRVLPAVIMVVTGSTKWRKVITIVFLLWAGFSSGMIMTASVIKMGTKGIVLCLVSLTPHFICYAAAYYIVVTCLYFYPHRKWNISKIVGFVIIICIGIILECMVNPALMQLYLKVV